MKRPWKVSWWSFVFGETLGTSFSTQERAMARAKAMVDDGFYRVRVWQNSPDGYVVGAIVRLS